MVSFPEFKIINEFTSSDGYPVIQVTFTKPIKITPPDTIVYKGKKRYLDLNRYPPMEKTKREG